MEYIKGMMRTFFAISCVAVMTGTAFADNAFRTIGNYAMVGVGAGDDELHLLAKIDTGADSTSIDAQNQKRFLHKGEQWVSFEVPGESDEKPQIIEAPVVDTVLIKRAGAKKVRRLVVGLSLCIGGRLQETEVNLANRKGLNYRLLIGREDMIQGDFLVNPALHDNSRPDCSRNS